MSQHLSEQDLERYFERTLSADDLLTFDDHMSECDPCLTKISARTAQQSVGGFLADDTTGSDEHLTYDQLEKYVDGAVDAVDKEIADVHTRVCETCAAQLFDLRQLRAALRLEDERSVPALSPTQSSFWTQIATTTYLKFAIPAFGALILGITIWLAWFLTRPGPNDVTAVLGPAPSTPGTAVDIEVGNVNASDLPANSNASRPAISLVDGRTLIELDANGRLKGLDAPQFENRVKSALTTQNIEISQSAKEMRPRFGVLMGDNQPGSPFALTAPIGRIVESDRPQFRWRPLNEAESYVVTIYDKDFNQVAVGPILRQTSWTSTIRLKRGVVYQWQVTAFKDGQEIKSPVRPAPDAKFKVLDSAAANDIQTARRQAGKSHLLLGILYANAGLLDEAEHEFQALLQRNPNSEITKRLLNKVKAAR